MNPRTCIALALALAATALVAQPPPPEESRHRPGMGQGMGPGGEIAGRPEWAGRPGMPPGGPGGKGPHGPGFLPGFQALGLSEPRQKGLQALAEKHRPAQRLAEKGAMDRERALHEALRDPASTEGTLKSLHAAAGEARWQVLQAHRSLLQEAQGLLTPEQKARQVRLQARMRALREAEQGLREELGPPPEGGRGPGPQGGPRK